MGLDNADLLRMAQFRSGQELDGGIAPKVEEFTRPGVQRN